MKDRIFQFIYLFSKYLSKVCIVSYSRDIDESFSTHRDSQFNHGDCVVNKYFNEQVTEITKGESGKL